MEQLVGVRATRRANVSCDLSNEQKKFCALIKLKVTLAAALSM